MSDLIQIVYISRSTFPPLPAENGIEPSVARILAQSRINNLRRGLVGGLFFGDGCFFQCLQGRAEDVDRLYATLLEDPRHTDLKVLSRQPVAQATFATWFMKYISLDSAMRILLERRGLDRFDPYQFDGATVDEVLRMLQQSEDVTPSEMLGRSVDLPFVTLPAAGDGRALQVPRVALALAVVALVVVLVGIWMRGT